MPSFLSVVSAEEVTNSCVGSGVMYGCAGAFLKWRADLSSCILVPLPPSSCHSDSWCTTPQVSPRQCLCKQLELCRAAARSCSPCEENAHVRWVSAAGFVTGEAGRRARRTRQGTSSCCIALMRALSSCWSLASRAQHQQLCLPPLLWADFLAVWLWGYSQGFLVLVGRGRRNECGAWALLSKGH
jgi:hypothetical protein